MTGFLSRFKQVITLDLRSLAVFRIGLSIMVIADLVSRASAKGLVAHYSDIGVLPREVLTQKLLHSGYWSLHLINGEPWFQAILFGFAFIFALCLLLGYRTRWAIILTWILNISLQNRNPALIFAGDDVMRALLFWAMFLPLGATYSIDSALNRSTQPLPKGVANGATFAFMVQLCFIYIWSAAFKTKSSIWWPDGDAVYYSLSFDQYVTAFGELLLLLPNQLLKILNFSALIFEWIGPLLIFIPIYSNLFRIIAIISFVLLHVGFELCFHIGVLSWLSIYMWLALIPSIVWDHLATRLATPSRKGLRIYYDADCGFCKKVVYLIRTFLILPGTPLLIAQDDPSIYEDMREKNSWVIVNWQRQRFFKFEGIAYVCSLSPIFFVLAPLFRWRPIGKLGRKFYETIANNRQIAGKFTKPLPFGNFQVKSSLLLSVCALILIFFTTIWNLTSFIDQSVYRGSLQTNDWINTTYQLLHRKTLNQLANLGYWTRLDQSWSIFAPAPPRDDGWHVIVGQLKDGSKVNLLDKTQAISWEKPTIGERKELYQTIQWRVYFINLNRAISTHLYPSFTDYLCRDWNLKHQGDQQLDSLIIYYMDERTAPPKESQSVIQKKMVEQSCSSQI